METLVEIGALGGLPGEPGRREALWQVAGLQEEPLLWNTEDPDDDSPLEEMTAAERIAADCHGTSLTVLRFGQISITPTENTVFD